MFLTPFRSSFRPPKHQQKTQKITWSLLASPLVLVFAFTFTFWILAIIFALLGHFETTNFLPHHSASPPGLELEEDREGGTICSMPDKLHSFYIRGLFLHKLTSVKMVSETQKWPSMLSLSSACLLCRTQSLSPGLWSFQGVKLKKRDLIRPIFPLHLETWVPYTAALYELPSSPNLTTIWSKSNASYLDHRQKQALSQKCADNLVISVGFLVHFNL